MKINPLFAFLVILISSLLASGLIFSCCEGLPEYKPQEGINRIQYPQMEEKEFFETAYSFPKKNLDFSHNQVVAGIIPHHLLAADLIAEFFANLEGESYDTIILIGPNHSNEGEEQIIVSKYDWSTPYGVLKNDTDFYAEFVKANGVGTDEEIIIDEHSIVSEIAFIKKTFPNAKFFPIIVKSFLNSNQAQELAQEIWEISKKQNKKVLLLASVDFSHYKNSEMAQANDLKSISAIEDFDFDNVYNLDIDSPASIFTVMKFSQITQSDFVLLNNSNSAILAQKPELESTTSYVTGYFVKK